MLDERGMKRHNKELTKADANRIIQATEVLFKTN